MSSRDPRGRLKSMTVSCKCQCPVRDSTSLETLILRMWLALVRIRGYVFMCFLLLAEGEHSAAGWHIVVTMYFPWVYLKIV